MKARHTIWAQEAARARFEAPSAAYVPPAAEVERIAAVKAMGAAPEACGPAIVRVAPARGAAVAFMPMEAGPGGRAVSAGYRGRHALQVADTFAAINAGLRRSTRRAPFASEQIEAARRYAALTERLASWGYGGSAAFADGGAGGGGHDRTDRMIAQADQLRRCHAAIGAGIAKEIRRRRPSESGKRRIADRALVDMVAIHGKSLSGALKAHGWAVSEKNLAAVYAALSAALWRLAAC